MINQIQNYKQTYTIPVDQSFSKNYFPLLNHLRTTSARLEKIIEEASQTVGREIVLEEPLIEDLWGFGWVWHDVVKTAFTVEKLYDTLKDLHSKIAETKERFRSKAESFPNFEITPNLYRGVSGSYFMVDEFGNRRFIIKPLDEDSGCINNPEGFVSLSLNNCIRDHMPAYKSAMREVLAYQIAASLGIEEVVPKTSLGILKSDQFHDLFNEVSFKERSRYLEICGTPDLEKLCSVQEYVTNGKSLFTALQEFQMTNLTDDEIAARLDQTDFENANILIWTTYDTDGHSGNFLVVPKGFDSIGNEIYGLKKIDNGLAFPDKNKQLRNNLAYLPNAKLPLSEEAKAKIASINVETLAAQFREMGLESAVPALLERIPILQKLAQEPNITIKEINNAMSKIGKKA